MIQMGWAKISVVFEDGTIITADGVTSINVENQIIQHASMGGVDRSTIVGVETTLSAKLSNVEIVTGPQSRPEMKLLVRIIRFGEG